MAIDILLSIGTNVISKGAGSGAARVLANAALLLEKFSSIVEVDNLGDDPDLIATSTEDNCRVNFAVCSAAPMIRDLAGGKDRAVIRFFNKGISCDCLKVKYAESKRSSQKVGACNACRQTFLRTDLMVCGTCRIGQYCSVECQSQAWKDHQDECKFLDLGQDGLQWLTTQEEDAKEVRRKQLIMKCNAI